MSDVSGVAAESTPAPVDQTPNPVNTEPEGHPAPDAKPEGKPEKTEAKVEAKPLTTRQALEKAAATVEKESKEAEKPAVKTEAKPDAKTEAKPDPKVKTEAKDDKPRGEHGHFASKDGEKTEAKPEVKPSHTAGDAPARFTKDVKDIWPSLPDNLRGEVSRMERELTQGYEKHKQGAEAYEGYRELDQIAQQQGKKGHEVFRDYYAMEQHLQKDLVGGLDSICQKMGVTLRDVAAHVLNQKPDEVAGKQDNTIRELRGQLAELTKQVGAVSQTFQQQQSTAVGKEVAAFAADHPRFEELHSDIAFFLKTRCPGDLKQAYELAERLNPAPASAEKTEAPKAPVIDLSAQTEKGSKSINGAPSAGSSPAASKPSNSIRDALKKAVAAAG